MLRYILSRLGQSLILLLIVSFIGFAVLTLAPGGPLSQFALSPGMTQEQIDKIAAQMGLDRPVWIQYFDWLRHLVVGDWGTSYRDGQSVLHVIGSHLFATLLLMGTATVISVTLGSSIGIYSALKRGGTFDYAMTVFAMVALSIPTFWFGLIAIYVFSLNLGWLPAGNMYTVGDGSLIDYLRHLIMPAMVLALVDVAIWSRYMRTSTLNVVKQDFVRTAKAKGLTRRRVLLKHIVGNSLVPMITLAGLQLPMVLGGALVTETVFTWPGMGRLFLDSLGYSDYPVVMGLLMASAMLVLIGNLLADLTVALIDPRIRLD
ncbi:ABC transporter permease [Celeribacter halophilus]|jgi:peptide/nickel transport system permease protein|uniref:ABC transporter permease n=1 Tax=Celeribacter halophilus TaxID=576117 RepID=A0A1I3WPA6_9RHOB|nr:ABC transporter permease [Celeribacter halophilus]MDO6458941.1 ABC transporter permease [Celeribacter halophilus]PZX06083.1 peptide/nickel transport system permease protein [Celeribacter halophilus]SFK08251.1 peptide/nickel transport system permease protein [Celeribacter halophilus]